MSERISQLTKSRSAIGSYLRKSTANQYHTEPIKPVIDDLYRKSIIEIVKYRNAGSLTYDQTEYLLTALTSQYVTTLISVSCNDVLDKFNEIIFSQLFKGNGK